MAETISTAILKFAPDIVSKVMSVTAESETVCKAGYPLTIANSGAAATVGNVGGSGTLGILAEDATLSATAKNVKVIYAGTVYADGILDALSTADIDKLTTKTPGKIIIKSRTGVEYHG